MEFEEILGPQSAFTGQPAPQSLESDFLSHLPLSGKELHVKVVFISYLIFLDPIQLI
jgi:hypothetical protein